MSKILLFRYPRMESYMLITKVFYFSNEIGKFNFIGCGS